MEENSKDVDIYALNTYDMNVYMYTPIHTSLKGRCQQRHRADHSPCLHIKAPLGNQRFLAQEQQIPDTHKGQGSSGYLPQTLQKESGLQAE